MRVQITNNLGKTNHGTSSSPKECLLLGPGRWGTLGDWEAFEETKINFVNRCILLNKADLASSSSSNLDCSLTWPSSSFTHHSTQSEWSYTSFHSFSDISYILKCSPYDMSSSVHWILISIIQGFLETRKN